VNNAMQLTGAHGDRDSAYLFRRLENVEKPPSEWVTCSSSMVSGNHAIEACQGKRILVFRNGDPYHAGEMLTVNSTIRTMGQLYRKLTEMLRPPCPVIELFDTRMRRVSRIDELEHHERYLACEGQGPTRKKHALNRFLSDIAPPGSHT